MSRIERLVSLGSWRYEDRALEKAVAHMERVGRGMWLTVLMKVLSMVSGGGGGVGVDVDVLLWSVRGSEPACGSGVWQMRQSEFVRTRAWHLGQIQREIEFR
jgi:hypothetical protein